MIKSNFEMICEKYNLTENEIISYKMYIHKAGHHTNEKSAVLEDLYSIWKEKYSGNDNGD